MTKPDRIETAEEATAAIEAAGYSNVTDLQQKGATWHATATDSSGQQVEVLIDGAGKVKTKSDDDEPEVEHHA